MADHGTVIVKSVPVFVSKHRMIYDDTFPQELSGKITEEEYKGILHSFEELFNTVMLEEQPKCESIAKKYCPCLIIPIFGLVFYVYKLKSSYSDLKNVLKNTLSENVAQVNNSLSNNNINISFDWYSIWREGKHREGVSISFIELN